MGLPGKGGVKVAWPRIFVGSPSSFEIDFDKFIFIVKPLQRMYQKTD